MIQAKMSEGGRVVVPAEIRKALGIKEGDIVLWELTEGEAKLTTRRQQLHRVRTLIRQYCPKREGQSVVDDLLAERRAEVARE
ncbi:MAG: AbrB/MazE/SpoVT family DNA-binding domain-containing protein [Deltaproteobacteria bacterium]